MYANVRACVRVYVCTCIRMYVCTCIRVYMLVHLLWVCDLYIKREKFALWSLFVTS